MADGLASLKSPKSSPAASASRLHGRRGSSATRVFAIRAFFNRATCRRLGTSSGWIRCSLTLSEVRNEAHHHRGRSALCRYGNRSRVQRGWKPAVQGVPHGVKEAAAPIATTGNGTFQATISKDETEINYVPDLQRIGGRSQAGAHPHWLSTEFRRDRALVVRFGHQSFPTPLTTPHCTDNDPSDLHAGRVAGTLTAADVRAQAGNGIEGPTPAEWSQLLGLVRAGGPTRTCTAASFPAARSAASWITGTTTTTTTAITTTESSRREWRGPLTTIVSGYLFA